MLSEQEILEIDKRHIWHPYSAIDSPTNIVVRRAQGSRLELADGSSLVDGMASWWSVIHGYNHPVLNAAVSAQLTDMAHVMFGGITHEGAALLAQQLVTMSPERLNRVFFADSGSVAIEVALKMAIQYWLAQGQEQKSRFISLRNGYHGDTLGAMAVCDPVTGMHHLFRHVLSENYFVHSPACEFGEPCSADDLAELVQTLETHHQHTAAVILEPIVQGTGGMRFYSAQYLAEVRRLCDQFGLLLIADEIATGFGRTGELFACNHAGISPDILCVGKALTGGYMTMAATLCTDAVAQGICNSEAGVFMHGPTFMANPLACSVANASINLLLAGDWRSRVAGIAKQLTAELSPIRHAQGVKDVRCLGAIGVVEMHQPVKMEVIIKEFIKEGVWIRPFGKLIYIMPPYTITEDELSALTGGIKRVISRLG